MVLAAELGGTRRRGIYARRQGESGAVYANGRLGLDAICDDRQHALRRRES